MPYNERLKKFQAALGAEADAAFFPLSADLQYLTGIPRDTPNFGATMHPGAWLEGAWISPSRAPVLTLPRMTAEFGGLDRLSGIDLRVLGDWDDPAQLVRDILRGFGLSAGPRIAVSERALSETPIALHAIVPDARFVSGTEILRRLRVIKSEEEIAIMRQAGAITEAAYADVLSKLRHGMTELEIVMEVDYQLRRHGGFGPSFTTSLYNSGPHHPLLFGQREQSWHRALHPPVSVSFDFGAIYQGYCYDFGRTVSFGEPSEEFRRVHRIVMEAQAAGIAALRAGANTTSQADAAARAVIENEGFGADFRHRLGHAIGLDVHEPPFLTSGDETPLREGMLFTIEPSIFRLDDFSVRVEDVVVARPGGGEKLTGGFQELHVVD